MLLTDALQLAQQMIATRAQHPLYHRVCELRKKYKALISGENIENLLQQFVRREDDEAFAQRVALTIAITPAVCSSLMKPFNKVSRNNKIRKNYDFKTAQRNTTVDKMRQAFYGRKRSTNRGLDYWLKNRYPTLSFMDPNAYVVIEWDTPGDPAAVIMPRPFEVSSENAWHWSTVNEDLMWLWVHTDICCKNLLKETGQKIAQARALGIAQDVPGDQFTLYDEDYTLVYKQVDPQYQKAINYVLQPNESYWKDEATKLTYLVTVNEPKLGFVPAYRVGYNPDPETEGQTCVNGWHEAMPYLMKSVKAVSEMDLSMALHTFPQKLQYVQKCPGVEKKKCGYGKLPDGTTCPSCKGIGYKVHTSAQDALFFPMPEPGTTNNEMLDLDKMLVYKGPPVDLLTFQKQYIDSLKSDCTQAVFTQTNLTKISNSPAQANTPITATETNNNMQGVYDAIFPFTEKSADVWIFNIDTFGRLAGTPEEEDVSITCVYPADPKMKSISDYLLDLTQINAASAPSFLRDQVYNDIAEALYEGDEIAELMYKVKHKFFPFNGQTQDEIALNMASQYVSLFTKVLYANFEAIFIDIDLSNVDFWFKNYEEQWAIVEEAVNEYITEIQASATPDLQITPGAGAGTDQTILGDAGAGDNGGNNDGGTPAAPPTNEPKPGDPGYTEPNI